MDYKNTYFIDVPIKHLPQWIKHNATSRAGFNRTFGISMRNYLYLQKNKIGGLFGMVTFFNTFFGALLLHDFYEGMSINF